ncbi:MAG: hypothetical protein ACRCWN_03540 [Fusobacteriaceae bacterium]
MDKKKIFLIAALMLLSIKAVSENSVEIDLNSDTLKSTEGLDVNYGDMKLKVLDIKRDKDKNMLYMNKPFTTKVYNPAGRVRLDAENGEIDTAGKNGKFQQVYGYLEVGNFTGAEYPNDKIYYGGETLDYKNGDIYLTDGWFTTDPAVSKTKNPSDAGFNLLSKSILIQPEKQVTFEKIDFYKRGKDYLPFYFPWYRLNIRPESTVPLFPMWGDQEDYGWTTSWGFLYGDKDSKYRGGFAPKFGDRMGWLVGRWENWYKFDKIGESKLNIDDWLIHKKNKEDYRDNRYSFNFLHNYTGEYGNFQMDLINSTANMVPSLDDIIKDYNGNDAWSPLGIKEIDKDEVMRFYSLDTSLKGLGRNKDISFDAQVKQVSDRDIYDVMVFDYVDDDSTEDYDLFSKLALYKDNERYKIGGYYNELKDMNPGSSSSDDRSRDESYGFLVQDKENKLELKYDKSTRDKFRPITFIESESDLKPWVFNVNNSLVGRLGDYTLSTIPEYTKYDSENRSIKAGEYEFLENSYYIAGYRDDFKENELAIIYDPFRRGVRNNKRDREWNRYENIAYEKSREQRGYVQIYNEDYALNLGGGKSKETIWDRDGYYNYENFLMGEAYDKYKLNSEFIDFSLEKKYFQLGNLGEFRFLGGLRYDKYTSASLNDYKYSDGNDDSLRLNGEVSHRKDLYTQEDKVVTNTLDYSYQGYKNEDIRLTHRENYHKINDRLEFDLGDKTGEYKLNYSVVDRASTGEKKNQIFGNSIALNLSEKQSLNLFYDTNERYTEKNTVRENKKDLTYENYGFNYRIDRHNFSYKKNILESEIWKIKNTDDSYEEIETDRFGYAYNFKRGDRLSLSYTEGSDFRENLKEQLREIDIKKKLYGISFLDYGTRYENNYSASFGRNEYLNTNQNTKTYSFGYSFLDKQMDRDFLEEYAMREYDKDREELTSKDLDEIASLMRTRAQKISQGGSTKFNLVSPWKRPVAFSGDYKRRFSINTALEKNEEKDKIEDLTVSLGYSQRRIGIGYTYSEELVFIGGKDSKDREHLLSLNMKIGKPSESYRLTTYAKFEDEWFKNNNKLEGALGVELGKEFGYYEWSIGFMREYDYGTRDNEWRAALQFTLLTFPDKPIFGLGAKRSSGVDSKITPETYLFDGIKASDVDLDD